MLMMWLFIVLVVYPLYPRVNHNYLDVVHPGAMIVVGAVIAQIAGRLKRLFSLCILVVAAANLVFLTVTDELHTRNAGMIQLYRSSLVDLTGLAGSNEPTIETVPAGMQIRANQRLLKVFGSQDNVLNQFHGIGRLFFLDENNRFILTYLAAHWVNSPHSADTLHYYMVRLNQQGYTPMPDDLPLAGPYYLRRAVPCEAVVDDDNQRNLPTWSQADYFTYDLITVRSLHLEKPVYISIQPEGQRTGSPFRYVLMVAYATKQETPVVAHIGKPDQARFQLQGSYMGTLPFTGATLFHVPCEPDCERPIHVWLNRKPENAVDLDVYGEPLS
jgi:hypothetical protein